MKKSWNGNKIINRINGLVLLILTVITGSLFLSPDATAKWLYMSRDQMISEADAIAIVVISKIERSDAKSSSDPSEATIYRQRGLATVEQLYKGVLPKNIAIYAGYGTRSGQALCAPSNSLEVGRSIVFLKRDGNLLVPMNDDLGIRPIVNNKVDWYELDALHRHQTNISDVIKTIKKQLQQAHTETQSKK